MTATPDCAATRAQLSGYLDGELSDVETKRIQTHLEACATCRGELQRLEASRRALRQHATRLTAPDTLRAAVQQSLRVNKAARWRHPSWAGAIAACLAVAALASVATWRIASAPLLPVSDLIARHTLALASPSLLGIASTDQHNVKPWFDGKVPFAPAVPRLDSAAFPLLGGRVDTVGHAPAAVLIYGRRLHTIEVFVVPAAAHAEASQATERGYHIISWTLGDLRYFAVSDVSGTDLAGFAAAFRAAPEARETP